MLSFFVSFEQELTEYLHVHIPISAAMGAEVVLANTHEVHLRFPLEPNINHRHTVFGGSESSAAILSAWSLLWIRTRDFPIRPKLVIRANTMEYTQPIQSEFCAQTHPIDSQEWQRFLEVLDRRKSARIMIQSKIIGGEKVCGTFSGTFVALVT